MKPIYEKIYSQTNASFKIKNLKVASFNYPYHYHPEYELTWIIKGSGHRFVGDHSGTFHANDLVFVGKNLPHCWLDYGENRFSSSAVVIQFDENSFGVGFFELPEMIPVKKMLDRAVKGIWFKKPDKKIFKALKDISGLSGLPQFIALLSIMEQLSVTENYQMLSGSEYGQTYANSRFERINKVFDYVSNNFKSNVNLTGVADLVHMTPSAFCHYFKKYTKKTFTRYLNEVRIGYACKLLMETDLTVTGICFQSGYNSLSMFNKCFRKITGKTPLSYRKQFIRMGNDGVME